MDAGISGAAGTVAQIFANAFKCQNCVELTSSAYFIDSLRLEKSPKIISCQPNPTMPAKPCLEVPHLHVGWGTPPPPWAAWPDTRSLFQERNFS